MVNSVSHNHAKKQLQILSISSYRKKDKNMDLSKHIFKSSNFIRFVIFFVAHNTKYLELIFYTVMGYTVFYIRDLFQYFLKLIIIFCNFFKRAGALELGSTKSLLIFLLQVESQTWT